MGEQTMKYGGKYDEYLAELTTCLAALSEHARTAVFWLWGMGLLEGLLTPDKWVDWLQDAEVAGRRHALGQEWLAEGVRLWELSHLLSLSEDELSAHLQSTVGCLESALCADPPGGDPCWSYDVLTPVMMSASLDVDDTVAWPWLDAEVDAMFATVRVQAAVAYVDWVVGVLASHPEPDEALLDELLVGAEVLSPPPGYDV
jgi:hypothetical protein